MTADASQETRAFGEAFTARAILEVGYLLEKLPVDVSAGSEVSKSLRNRLVNTLAAAGSLLLYREFSLYRGARRTSTDRRLDSRRSLYDEFCGHLALPLLAERYGAWSNLMDLVVEQWRLEVTDLFVRLKHDHPKLVTAGLLTADSPLELVNLTALDSDRHHGGRTVWMLELTGGKLIYKPRAVELEACLNEFLNDLEEVPALGQLRAPAALPCRGYGWVQFVESAPCSSTKELRLLFTRAGILGGLLHLLGAFDMFSDNVISSGSMPIVIDAETLLHPRPISGQDQVQGLVTATGLFPAWVETDEGNAVDLSYMGDVDTVKYGSVLAYENSQTDDIRLVRKPLIRRPSTHSPSLRGVPADATPFIGETLAGLEGVLSHALRSRHDWCRRIEIFADRPVRYVHRATSYYESALAAGLSPSAMESSQVRWNSLNEFLQSGQPPSPFSHHLASSEANQLLGLDIPYFRANTTSTELRDDAGTYRMFEQSSFDTIRVRATGLSRSEIDLQVHAAELSIRARKAHLF